MEVFDYFCDHVSWWIWLIAFIAFSILLLREKPDPAEEKDLE